LEQDAGTLSRSFSFVICNKRGRVSTPSLRLFPRPGLLFSTRASTSQVQKSSSGLRDYAQVPRSDPPCYRFDRAFFHFRLLLIWSRRPPSIFILFSGFVFYGWSRTHPKQCGDGHPRKLVFPPLLVFPFEGYQSQDCLVSPSSFPLKILGK